MEHQTEAMHRPIGGANTKTPKLLPSDYEKPKGVTTHGIPDEMTQQGGVADLHPYNQTPQQKEAVKRFLERIRKWSEEQRKNPSKDEWDDLPPLSDYD